MLFSTHSKFDATLREVWYKVLLTVLHSLAYPLSHPSHRSSLSSWLHSRHTCEEREREGLRRKMEGVKRER